MILTEAKKVIRNLNKMVKEYDDLNALKRFMEKPENEHLKNEAQLKRITTRMENVGNEILRHINF